MLAAATSSSLGTHQPGLDGMRAFGMFIMLAYHGELPWSQGAFLALSQFFTLSGFLITGVLLRNHLVPGGSLRGFWERRVRRLMPAAFLALAGIMLFGATVATRQQADALPGQIAGAATWTANWQFIFSGASYIHLFAAPSPVQHFWSLAIEEQFYLLFPLGLFLLLRRTRSPLSDRRRALRSRAAVDRMDDRALPSTARASTASTTAPTPAWPSSSWARSSRSSSGTTGSTSPERTRQVLAVAGVAAFAATLWCWVNIPLADGAIWKGGFLLFALTSATMILSLISGRGPLVRLFSWGPFPAIGRITYGIYLYHWPIFLWLDEDRVGLSRWPLFGVRLAVTLVAAFLSYHLVERPIMRGASLGIRGRARFAIAPVLVAAVIAGAFITVNRSATDPLETLHAERGVAQDAARRQRRRARPARDPRQGERPGDHAARARRQGQGVGPDHGRRPVRVHRRPRRDQERKDLRELGPLVARAHQAPQSRRGPALRRRLGGRVVGAALGESPGPNRAAPRHRSSPRASTC